MPPKDQHIAQVLLSRAHSPTTSARIFTEKVIQRPLHLKPTTAAPPTAQVTRRLERQRKLSARKKKNKPAPLSSRQKRALCLYELPKSAQKYAIYEPLKRMWQGYIQEVLGIEAGSQRHSGQIQAADAAKLCSADFHGAELEVVRSRCVSRVGVRGIVVKDSMHVFELVTAKDEVKILPKEGTIFRFRVPVPAKEGDSTQSHDHVGGVTQEDTPSKDEGREAAKGTDLIFELHGDQFRFRAADRANRKFKSHFLPDL